MHKISNQHNKNTVKPKIQITTKGPLRKHVLILLDKSDKEKVLNQVNEHVALINNLLKSYKSKVSINCVQTSWNEVTITTNVVASTSDLSLIEQYFKGLKDLITTDVSPRLPQSKSYLKILGIFYYGNNFSNPINNSQVEEILSKTDMFHGITLAACPRVLQASRNSDMSVIWIDIWNSQNSMKAKSIINQFFNFGRHITMVGGTSINPSVP